MSYKFTDLNSNSSPAAGDLFPNVDVSDTTQGANGSTKKSTLQQIADFLASLAQTLTNKTIDLTDNTLTGTTAEFNTALSDGNFATLAGNETLTNKTIATADNTITSASLAATGVIEIATAAETTTGTDATRAVSPGGLAGSDYGKRVLGVEVFEPATNCSTGDGKKYLRIPSILNGYNLVGVAAMVVTAGTTNTLDIQIHNLTQGADMLTTKLTIDSAETDSLTAAAAVIDTANDDVATGDRIRIDIDAVHSTPAKGLIVELTFQLP